jgi:hypothetical protein
MNKSIRLDIHPRDFKPLEFSAIKYMPGTFALFGFLAALCTLSPLFNVLRHWRLRVITAVCLMLAFTIATLNTGCVSAAANQGIAAGEVLSGDIYTTAKLDAVDQTAAGLSAQKSAVTDLQLVSADLGLFVQGKLTQFQLGFLNGKLQADKVALSGNQKAVDQITGILNLLAQAAVSNGYVTPVQALVQGNATNIQNGINAGIQLAEGKWSATDPAGWPAPSS